MEYKYHPKTEEELLDAIEKEIILQGNSADLNCIDTSAITDMSTIFNNSQFNGDISKWNVSKVTNMVFLFYGSQFNGDISKWNVSKVRYMRDIFLDSKFDGDISKWNIDNVEDDRSSLLEFGVYKGDHSSEEDSKESGLTYSDRGESSLVCYDEDSQPGKKDGEEPSIFDKLKNAFGKIFGTL